MVSCLKPELQPPGKYIISLICRITRQQAFFIPDDGIIKGHFGLRVDIINITDTEGRELDIRAVEIGIGFADIFCGYFYIRIIPVEFNDQLVLHIDDMLEKIKETAVKMPDISW